MSNGDEQQRRIDLAVARAFDQHQRNRESLLANEGFAISMQQVVAGGLLLGVLSQWRAVMAALGPVHLIALILAAGIALIAAVLAAQFRHDYRMWDVKASASAGSGNMSEAKERSSRADRFLWLMRYAMWTATVLIAVAVLVALAGVWLVAVWHSLPVNTG